MTDNERDRAEEARQIIKERNIAMHKNMTDVLPWIDQLLAERIRLLDKCKQLRSERDELWVALDGVMNSHGEQLHDAFAVARTTLEKNRT